MSIDTESHAFLQSEGWIWEGQIWAVCECGWCGSRYTNLMDGLKSARADVEAHMAETGHVVDADPSKFHLRCGVRHGLDDDCPRPADSAAGLLVRSLNQSRPGRPAAALDRLSAIQLLRARLDEEEKEAVIGARLARCTWTEMGQAVGVSRQGAWNRWGPMVQRYEAAGLMRADLPEAATTQPDVT